MPRRIDIWKRHDICEKEDHVSLGGTAAETQLTPAAEAALDDAITALRPHADHPAIGGVLGKLRGLSADKDSTALGGEAGLEKAVTDMIGLRAQLRKSDADPALIERVEKASKDVQLAYLRRQPTGAHAEQSAREHIEHARKSESGGRAA
jgi:hypothetical protein